MIRLPFLHSDCIYTSAARAFVLADDRPQLDLSYRLAADGLVYVKFIQ